MDQVIQQSRSAPLERAVTDELAQPADYVGDDGDFVRKGGVHGMEVVRHGSSTQTYHGQSSSSYRFQEHV